MKIHIFLPKRRMADCNRLRWRFNHHKMPRYLNSEINKAIRDSNEPHVIKSFFRDELNSRYNMEC